MCGYDCMNVMVFITHVFRAVGAKYILYSFDISCVFYDIILIKIIPCFINFFISTVIYEPYIVSSQLYKVQYLIQSGFQY